MDRNDRIHGTARDGSLETVCELHHETHGASAAAACSGAEQTVTVNYTLSDQAVYESHLQGVVTVYKLYLIGIQRSTVRVILIGKRELQSGTLYAFLRQSGEAAVGHDGLHQGLVILTSAYLPYQQRHVLHNLAILILGQPEHILTGQSGIGKTALDAVIYYGGGALRYILGSNGKTGLLTFEFPWNGAEVLTQTALGTERTESHP